ncbi:MAG: 50S ribosomal protein L18 [Nanoarchaeota archaeon]|nr:50S ribosomal protein L18 [Nanoarchaeota archaeon]
MSKTQRRRRRERKTDYKARFAMLKSEKPRFVVRKTNKYIIAQLVESDIAQDKIVVRVSSKDLLSKGWPKEKEGSLKSVAAAYLTGMLLAKSAKLKDKEAILDVGLYRTVAGSRIFAALKGAVDGGLNIPHKPEVLPSMERLESNEKTKDLIKKIKEKI